MYRHLVQFLSKFLGGLRATHLLSRGVNTNVILPSLPLAVANESSIGQRVLVPVCCSLQSKRLVNRTQNDRRCGHNGLATGTDGWRDSLAERSSPSPSPRLGHKGSHHHLTVRWSPSHKCRLFGQHKHVAGKPAVESDIQLFLPK